MTAAPRGPDLSFLNEEEAKAIFQVLQRDSELRRAEKNRISKLLKTKNSKTGLQGITGEWFEEIQRKKFQNYVDVNKMLKPPLEHQIKKSKNTISHYKPADHIVCTKMSIKIHFPGKKDHKELKMSSRANPQAQKNTTTSFLGFRSPFAWLSYFRKSRKNQTQKQPRYDSSADPSSKVEEMATAEVSNSPLSAEPSGHSFDANQNEMMEKITQEWNEQLEKEFFSVLNDLDDQLAQEQAQEPWDRTVSTSSVSNAQYSSAFSTSTRQTAGRGQHRNDWSEMPGTFFPDGLRTMRAKDEHKIFIRPRKLRSAYINWHQAAFQEGYRYGDPADGSPHLQGRQLSSASFGRSSEGSLYPPSVTQNSGFRHKSCMNRDTAGRSYSVCSLRRCPSSVSSDQLSASSLQNPLARENNNGFVPRFGRQNPKRIPLSSIVWNNTPDSPGQTSAPEKVFRTQSLMEFHATDHGRYPNSLQETKKYAYYHPKHHYRRSISSSNCFSRVSCPDEATSPLAFDNWENYPLYKSENNLSRSYFRDRICHEKNYTNQKNSSYGRKDSYPSWADTPQYYGDEAFISSDASSDMMMSSLNDQQWPHTKNAKFGSQRLQNDFHIYSPENMNVKKITRSASRTFSEFTEGCQPSLSCNSSISSSSSRTDESVFPNMKDLTKPIGLNRNSVAVTQRSSRAGFSQLEKVKGVKLPDEDLPPLQSISQHSDKTYINTQSFPSSSPASAMLQSVALLFNTMRSKRQPQVTGRGDIAKTYTSNSDERNVQMKENYCPPSSVFCHPPCVLPADESRKELFLPRQKEWEHNLHYAAKREIIKQDNCSAEAINQAAPKRLSSLLNVASAPSTEKIANCQGILSCPQCSSSSSQTSPQALSHKDNSKCLGTLTSSSVNCTITESRAEGGKTAQMSRIGVAKKISQNTLQNASTLLTKDCKGQFPTSCPQDGNSGSIYMRSFGEDSKTSEHSVSYFCLEKESGKIRSDSSCTGRLHKQDRLLRHSSSCSITGSLSRNSLKSPDPLVIYYTLPRKSASIAGTIMADTPISLPRENRERYNCLRSENSRRADAFCSYQRYLSCLDSKNSFLRSPSLNTAASNKDYSSPLMKSHSDSESSSASVELTDNCKHLSRGQSSVFSDCNQRGNFLQKYKTTSTFTVCVDEDHIKYHELVSIYYTLPRRHSKTFCKLFRENQEDADLPCPKENAPSSRVQNKRNEGHVSSANAFFPSTLEREVLSYSSDQTASAVVTPLNLGTADDSEDENSHLPPSSQKRCTSKAINMAHNRQNSSADLSLAENVFSDMVTEKISFGGLRSTATVAKSDKAISDASSSQNTEIHTKEKKEATLLMPTSVTPPKPGRCLENPLYSMSTNKNSIQKGSSENGCHLPKGNINSNSLFLHPGEKSSLGRSSNTEHADVSLPPAEDKYRDGSEVKQRVNFLHQTTPLYNNKCSGLQLRADSSRKNTNYLNSCSKVFSESQNKASEASLQIGSSSADPLLQVDEVVNTGTDELKNSKISKEQSSQNNQMGKDYSGLQESERQNECSLNINCKLLRAAQGQKIAQSAEDENKLLSACTRDKIKDIEKRKNRPSIKNKLAAVYKTSRKFSSKNLPPKPHISNIFSQNNGSTTSLVPLDSMISTNSHQPLLQLDNENQNHSLDPDKNTPRQRAAENSTEDQNNPSLLVNNTNWRSSAISYSQKEAISPKKTAVKVENRPTLTTLFPEKAVTTSNNNSQALDLGLESKIQPISSRATTSEPLNGEKRRAISCAYSPPLPILTDKNSNTYVNICLEAGLCPEQNLISQAVLGQCQNTSQSASLNNVNLQSSQLHKSRARSQRERHLSETVCAQDSRETFASGSNILPKDGLRGKRFKSYSELLSCDENENWASDNEKCYSTRNVMYPSVEFGIFGKEQQLAFLENIKRSLTEGRLWRPCLLNNPGALRDAEAPSINRAELLSSGSAGSKMSSTASSPREPTDIYQDDPAAYSDSDSDTTTDDEYYLDEVDKESEL